MLNILTPDIDTEQDFPEIEIVDGIIKTSSVSSSFEQEMVSPVKIIPLPQNDQTLISETFFEDPITILNAAKSGRPKKYEGYFLFLNAAGRSQRTIKGYKSDLRYWTKYSEALKKTMYTLKVEDVEKAIAGKDINTVRRLLASLRSLSRWYLRDGYPALNIELQKIILGKGKDRLAKAKDNKEYLRIREQAKALAMAGDRRGIWIGLMLMCGLRISEIETATTGDRWIQVLGKGNKERRVPCPDWLIEAMNKAKKKERGGYQKKAWYLDRVLRQMGYKNVHSLRHTYATYLLNNGVTIDVIKELLGHASILTTQVYAKAKITGGICEILEK